MNMYIILSSPLDGTLRVVRIVATIITITTTEVVEYHPYIVGFRV